MQYFKIYIVSFQDVLPSKEYFNPMSGSETPMNSYHEVEPYKFMQGMMERTLAVCEYLVEWWRCSTAAFGYNVCLALQLCEYAATSASKEETRI